MYTVSVQAKIVALEGNLSDSHTKSVRTQSFKAAETERDTDSSGSSMPSHLKNVVKTSAVKANMNVSSKTSVSLASAKPTWINYSRLVSTTIIKPASKAL